MLTALPRIIVSLLFAVAFSQAPPFFQQYTQNVAQEIRLLYRMQRHVSGYERQRLMDQYGKARRHYDDMRGASVSTRPIVFFSYMNREAAQTTWRLYKPAAPTTVEGGVYAVSGFLVGSLLFSAAAWMLRRRRSGARYGGAQLGFWGRIHFPRLKIITPPWFWQGLVFLAMSAGVSILIDLLAARNGWY